jgi:hypothetical protein
MPGHGLVTKLRPHYFSPVYKKAAIVEHFATIKSHRKNIPPTPIKEERREEIA